jgi:pyruvate formate lyase activating enzyme
MKQKQPIPPQIPLWTQDAHGRITPKRDAQFWKPLPGGAVACTLCYRNCVLQRGETGWCDYRTNVNGRMVLKAHGQIGALWRWLLAYSVGSPAYMPGAIALGLGQLHCTAACNFCYVSSFSTHPERMPWLGGRLGAPAHTGGHYGARAMLHPSGAIAQAQRLGCTELAFSYNEPLLSWEWTFDTCRLAKVAGLGVTIFTNGFSSVDAIRKLAPYVTHVKFGIKGSGDSDFYARHMRSAGAMDAVRASVRAWRDAGVRVSLSDVIPAAHMQTDAAAEDAQQRFYAWAVEVCSPLVVLHIGELHKFAGNLLSTTPLISAQTGDAEQYRARVLRAVAIAKAAGLHYVHNDDADQVLTCHACAGVLVRTFAPADRDGLQIYPAHEQHATNGQCDHCGASVPVVTLTPAQLAEARRRWNDEAPPGEQQRIAE